MTLTVLITRPALTISARIPVEILMDLVARMPSVRRVCIGQSADALLDGVEILMSNAINVGFEGNFFITLHLLYSIPLLPDECLTNDDCPLSKACVSQECVDPCLRTSCGHRAECEVNYHTARCLCPQGLQGNPLVSCQAVGCQQDEDCDQKERCDFSSQQCIRLCQGQTCAQGAICDARNHKESCTCRPPLEGDGYVYCERRKDPTHDSLCCLH